MSGVWFALIWTQLLFDQQKREKSTSFSNLSRVNTAENWRFNVFQIQKKVNGVWCGLISIPSCQSICLTANMTMLIWKKTEWSLVQFDLNLQFWEVSSAQTRLHSFYPQFWTLTPIKYLILQMFTFCSLLLIESRLKPNQTPFIFFSILMFTWSNL